ncbi:MAG: ABC transporter ATP-binding protein [Bdellovibrionales bacterium]
MLFRLLKYLKNYKTKIYLACTYSVLNKLFDIAPEILIGMAIDVVVSKEQSFIAQFGYVEPMEQITVLGVLTFIVWFGESVFEYLLLLAWRGLAQSSQHLMRIDTYYHVQKLDMAFFEDKSSGNLVSIMNDDINQLERFLDSGINMLIQTFVAVVGVGAVFFVLSPKIALLAFTPIPVIVIGAFWFQKRASVLYEAVRAKVGDISSRLTNNIGGISTIKSFTSEDFELSALRKDSEDYLKANEKAIRVSSAFIPVIRMAILSGFLMTFVIGGREVIAGNLPVGSYGVLVFLTQRLLWPLTGLASTVDLYERAMASVKRILDLLETPIKIKSGDQSLGNLKSSIRFDEVDFKYGTGSQILNSLSLEVPVGKTTAFVGGTGSGKSTLVKLLLKFYDIQSGDILFDDQSISEIDIESLRSKIGLVSQDIFLFHGTVLENIAYAKPHATMNEVVAAAKLAEADEFISALPEDYKTVIGERGQKLSGGQRQRLSIARALLKDPPILILDEATSAVDNETEAAIQKSMEKISIGRTVIVIAHRLSTIVTADRIYVLADGQIAEKGSHQELKNNGAYYQSLWDLQAGKS